QMVHNLLSIHQFTADNSCSIEFDSSGLTVKDSASRPSTPPLMPVSSLLSDPHTPLVLLPSWLVMGLAFLSPPWVLLLVLFVFPMSLLLLRWFIIFFPFISLQLTILIPSSLILLPSL